MAIKSENFTALIFLIELHTQCALFNSSISYLEKVVNRQTDRNNGIYLDDKFPPIEIIAQCTVCLSSLSTIRRILFTCDREKDDRKEARIKDKIQKRCNYLMGLLGNPIFENISSPVVRNAWEHIDENLDKYLSNKEYTAISPIYIIGSSEPDHETLALKIFNAKDFSISFVNKTINLKACSSEIIALSECIDAALHRLGQNLEAFKY
jgi:hypothetical protein